MTSRQRTEKRKVAPKKFEEKPGLPSDEEGDSVREEDLFSENDEEDDIYNSSENESYFSTSSESEDEDLHPHKKEIKKKNGPRLQCLTGTKNCERSFCLVKGKIIQQEGTPRINTRNFPIDTFYGKGPVQAGKKAFTKLCKNAPDDISLCYIFYIKETTRNSTEKEFSYIGYKTFRKPERDQSPKYDIKVRAWKESKVKNIPVQKKKAGRPPKQKI